MRVCRKIRFIEPHGRQGRPFNVWLAKWPLLGPITLATILHERGYDAAVYNENVSGPLTENSAAYQDICSADVVGFSIMTPTAARGYQLADQIKRDAPKARIVFGGIHATFMTSEALVHGDIVVRGEGERVIEQIASGEIESGVVTGLPLENLDSIPTLNYELMRDFDTLILRAYRRDLYDLPVMASRGCPYRCTFCSVSRMFGQQVRRQSTGKVWKDMSRYREQGFRRFFFYDDNFTSNREWARDLMRKIKPLDIRYSAQTRADFHWLDGPRSLLDRPLLHAMREAGGYVLYIGYETIDDSTASEWRKGYRGGHMLRERLVEDTRILHGNDFWIHGMFVVGPQHGMETMDQIVRFARQTKIETMQISILTPFPGTPLFDQMRPHVIFREFPQDWDFYDGTHCVYRHGRLGIRGLQEAVLEAHRRFYRRHGLSLRRIRDAFEQKVPLGDRLRVLWSNARVASKTLRQWNEETKMFLELASRREATSLNR